MMTADDSTRDSSTNASEVSEARHAAGLAIDAWQRAARREDEAPHDISPREANRLNGVQAQAYIEMIDAILATVEASDDYEVDDESGGVAHAGRLWVVLPCRAVRGMPRTFRGSWTVLSVPLANVVV